MKSSQSNVLDKKQIFLLLFTKELIRNSGGLSLLEEMIKQKSKPIQQIQPQENNEELPVINPVSINQENELPIVNSIISKPEIEKPQGELSVINPVSIKSHRMEMPQGVGRLEYPILKIPEPKLPQEFQYLKPVPTRKEIDLEKLNPLIGDSMVREIECEGPNKPVIVSGMMGRKPTGILLSNNEIEDVINRFSRVSKIPADVGIFKVVVGNLIFSAIISEVVPSRFTITKMPPQNQITITNPNFRQPNQVLMG